MYKLEEASLIYEEYIHNMTRVIFGSRKQASEMPCSLSDAFQKWNAQKCRHSTQHQILTARLL